MRPFQTILGMWMVITASVGFAPVRAAEEQPGTEHAKSDDRVVVMYFHRTQRCPTCQKMGAYVEEAVKTQFAEQMDAGRVSVHMVDFEDAANEKFTKAYGVSGPTLVIADVRDGEVAEWKEMPEIWSLVRKKEDFFTYVQSGVGSYLERK